MEASIFFGILFAIVSLEAWIKIISSFFTGNYYETDKSLCNGQVQITYRFFYGVLFNNKILENGLEVQYSWINVEKGDLVNYLKSYNLTTALTTFKILDAFEIYLRDGNSDEFEKKKPSSINETFFKELKRMHLDEEKNEK